MSEFQTISLSKIPAQGLDLHWQSSDETLESGLKEFLESYDITLKITLLDADVYEVTGRIVARRNLLCSRCATDVPWTVDKPVKELLRVETDWEGKDQTPLTPDALFSEPFCHVIPSDELIVSQYILEHILTVEPVRPLGVDPEKCEQGICPNFIEAQKRHPETPVETPKNAFSSLKDFKLS